MALDGDALGDLLKSSIDGTTLPERRALFRAFGNALVRHIALAGIAASGADTGSDMFLWMTQVGGSLGFAPSFAGASIARAIAPSYSTVTARCVGAPGTLIPQGRVASVTGSGERFDSTAPAMVGGGGYVDVLFQAESSGAVIASAGALSTIVTAVVGWDSVSNSSSATPGVDPVALNGNTLGDLIKSNIDAVGPPPPGGHIDRQQIFRAIGQAIVQHIADSGIAADPLMAAWMGQVEAVINFFSAGSVAPLSAAFDSIAIVK